MLDDARRSVSVLAEGRDRVDVLSRGHPLSQLRQSTSHVEDDARVAMLCLRRVEQRGDVAKAADDRVERHKGRRALARESRELAAKGREQLLLVRLLLGKRLRPSLLVCQGRFHVATEEPTAIAADLRAANGGAQDRITAQGTQT